MELYSYDIFDTLITRRTATPYGVFAIMSHILQNDISYSEIPLFVRKNFYILRISCEKQASKINKSRKIEETTIEEIYRTMLMTGELNETQAEMLCQLEKQVELDNVVAIRSRIEELLHLYESGKRVVLISDMYLDEETIRMMLNSADDRLADIPLYLSSTLRLTKRSGHLYEYVRKSEKTEYYEWTHTGDNISADLDIPEKLGIKVCHVPKKEMLAIEKAVLNDFEQDITAQMLIGAASNARIISGTSGDSGSLAVKFGTALLTPMLYGYIAWVLDRAGKTGLKKLYFIARDGYLLKEFADRIIEIRGYDIETDYLYGSRDAWRVSCMNEEFWDLALFFKWSDDKDYTVNGFAKRFHITANELLEFLPVEMQKTTARLSQDKVAEALQNNSAFRDYIFSKERNRRELLVQYLEENINLAQGDYAFVEFIGSGYSQKALSYVLRELTDYPTITFFYRLDADLHDEKCVFYSYCPGFINHKMIECLLTAPHGRTEGYMKAENGEVRPVLNDENRILDEYGMGLFRDGVKSMLGALNSSVPGNLFLEKRYFDYLKEEGDEELWRFIGEMPFNSSGRSKKMMRYAPVISEEDVKNIYYIRLNEPLGYFYQGIDLKLSLRRSGDTFSETAEQWGRRRWTRKCFEDRIQFWNGKGEEWISLNGYSDLFNQLGQRIVIYGGGRIGQTIAGFVITSTNRTLVKWIDKNHERLNESGWEEISLVSESFDAQYDNLIIAVKDNDSVKEIKASLDVLGILDDRVIAYNDLM